MALMTHEQLTQRLAILEIPVAADYLQGVLAGLASAGINPDSPHWALQLGDCLQDVDIAAHLEVLTALQVLCERELASPDFGFQLLLPDAEEFLSLRAAALSQWCDGFINGFVAGQIELSAEDRETLDDLAAITQLESSEDYNNPENANENETDFMELTEYVRMAVITLHALKAEFAKLDAVQANLEANAAGRLLS